MNIMFTSDLSGMGGGETSLVNLSQCLSKNNKVVVVCNTDGKLVRVLEEKGIKTFITNYRDKSNLLRTIGIIRKIIKDEKIDVIHSNDPLTSVLMNAVTLGMKCQNYWTCHGQWYDFSFLKRTMIMLSNRHIFCVSSKVQESLRHMGFKNTSVSYLGIPLEIYSNANKSNIRQDFKISKDSFVIASIARFQPIKGQLKLVKAIDRMSREGYNIICLLIGGCIYNNQQEENYYAEIKNYISNNKLEKVVFLTGERDDIPGIMKTIDLLVVPSDNESFGMVAVEALASELPVITTPNDGVSEILDYSSNFISRTNDDEGLYDSIKNYINNPELRFEAIDFCKKKKTYYDINRISQTYYNVFKNGENK